MADKEEKEIKDDTRSDESGNTDNLDNNDNTDVDVSALADLISDKDKKLEELEAEITKLKKANASMLVQINAGRQEEPSIDDAILSLDTRKITR